MNRFAIVVRVGTLGQPAFQLRKGETGLSVFDPHAADPPLTDEEILEPFRSGSVVVYRTLQEVAEMGLQVIETPGAEALPDRLRLAHREIAAATSMTRPEFKTALKRLEDE